MGITTENIQVVVTMDTKKAAENAAKFRKEIEENSKKLNDMKPNSKEFNAEMNKLVKATEGFAKNSNFNTIKREYNAINKNLKTLTKGTKEWIIESAKTKVLKAELDKIRGKQNKYTKSVNDSTSAWTRLKRIGAGGATAIVAGVGLGLNSLKDFASESLKLYDIQAKAEAQLKTTIISTNQAAGRSYEQLVAQASELQGTTLFGDEDTIGAQSLLLTFTKVREEIFDRSIPAIQDMATAMGTDLKGASIQVGKALNDPLKGISALSRSGVSFDESQKKVIKTLVETGETAKAQTIILEALEEQFGGSAAAAAAAGTGGITQFQNSIGDVKEEIGKLIQGPFKTGLVIGNKFLQFFVKFLEVLQVAPKFIKENSNLIVALATAYAFLNRQTIASTINTAKNIVVEKASAVARKASAVATFAVSGAVAAYNTVTGLLSGRLKIAAVAQTALNFALSANPIGLVIIAIGALTAGFIKAYQSSETFRATISGLADVAKTTFEIIKEATTSFIQGFQALKSGDLKGALKGFANVIIATNPIGIAVTQGKRLATSFQDGYNEQLLEEEADKLKFPDQAQEAKTIGQNTGQNLTDGIIDGIQNNTQEVIAEAKSLADKIKEQIDQLRTDASLEQNIDIKRNLLFKAKELEQQLEAENKKLEELEFSIDLDFALEADPAKTIVDINEQIQFLKDATAKTDDLEVQVEIAAKIEELEKVQSQIKNNIERANAKPIEVIQPIAVTTVTTVEEQQAVQQAENLTLPFEDRAKLMQTRIEKIESQTIVKRLEIQSNYLTERKAILDIELISEEERKTRLSELETQYQTDLQQTRQTELESLQQSVLLKEELGLLDEEYFSLKAQLKEAETEKVLEENAKQKASQEELINAQKKGLQNAGKAFGGLSKSLGEIADNYEEGSKQANFFTKASKAFAVAQTAAAAAANLLAIAQQAQLPFPGNVIAIASTVASVFSAVQQIKSLLSAEDGGVVYAQDGAMVNHQGNTYRYMPDVVYAENGSRFIYSNNGNGYQVNEHNPIFAEQGAKFVVENQGVRKISWRDVNYKMNGEALEKNTGQRVYQVKSPSVYAESGLKINKKAGIAQLGQRHRRGGIKMFDGTSGQYIGEWEKGEAYMIYSRKTVGKNKRVVDQLLYNSMHKQGANIFETNPELLPPSNQGGQSTREQLSAATQASSKRYFELGGVAGLPSSAVVNSVGPSSPGSSDSGGNSAKMEALLGQLIAENRETNRRLGLIPTNLAATVDYFQLEEFLEDLAQAQSSDL